MENKLLPTTPEHQNNIKLLILAILAGVVILGGLFFYFSQFRIEPSVLAPEQNRLSQSETITLLAQKSSLTFSMPVSSFPTALESLPDYAKYLIFPGASNISIEQASFQGNKQGFTINYKTIGGQMDLYRAFILLSFNDWKVVYGSRTDNVALIDLSGSSSMSRIILTSDGQNIDVSITVINL